MQSKEPTLRPSARSTYVPGLDGIRAIAFLLVFWAHALPGVSYYIPATLGVTLFFFLSGFLITTLLRRELERTGTIGLRDFYIRRTLRIFVPLYLVYALACVVTHFYLHQSFGNKLGFFSMLLYFYNYAVALEWKAWLPPGLIVIWSLAVEEHFYLLFPVALLWMRRRRMEMRAQVRVLVWFCVAELVWRTVLWQVLHIHTGWTYAATDARLDGILWGCILALRNNPVFGDASVLPRNPRRAFAVFASTVAVLLGTLFIRDHLYRESLRYTLQALCFYVIFSYVIPNIRNRSVAWLEWTPLRYIGWTSYVLYLSHDFILTCVNTRLTAVLWQSSVIAFALALLFATAMRYGVELPLQRVRARFRHVPEADLSAADGHGLIS